MVISICSSLVKDGDLNTSIYWTFAGMNVILLGLSIRLGYITSSTVAQNAFTLQCVPKKDPWHFQRHFGRALSDFYNFATNITYWSGNQKIVHFPTSPNSVSTLHGETDKHEIKCCMGVRT